jgi:large subunit ribosomal protein L21
MSPLSPAGSLAGVRIFGEQASPDRISKDRTMYAVIKTGGKQYRVQPGDLLVVEKLEGDAGAEISFDQVLAVGEGADVMLGAPLVAGAAVTATLIETRKGEKIKIFKKIRRQGYRRTRGHRQPESVLRVTSIAAGKGKEEKWDGKVDLTTKAELNARARGLKFQSPVVQPSSEDTTAKAPKAKAPAKAKAPKADAAPLVDAPVSEIAPGHATTEATASEMKAAPKKAAAPKKDTAEKPAAKKPAAKKADKA